MIIHNPILTGSFTVNGTDVASITSSAASITAINAYTASQNILNGTYATTGSNTFKNPQTINSNLIVTGSITAATLVVQTITSSVDFVTGSTRFGSLSSNTHVITGSMYVTGALYVATGSVGIGTTSPISTLSVATTSNTSSLGSTGLTIGGSTVLTTGSVLMLNFTAIGADSARARAGIGCVVGSDWGTGNLTFYTRAATDASAMTTADERMRITSTGIIYNSNPPANDFAARFVGNTTTGQSFGLQVWGGTNSSDTAFRVLNASTSTEYFKIRGDGEVIVTQSVTAAAFTIPSGAVAGSRQILSGENTNTGTTGKMRILLQNLSTSFFIEKYGTGYTTSGIATQAGSAVYDDGAGGLSIGATNASGELRLFSGNTLRMRIFNDGYIALNSVVFGNTTSGTTRTLYIGDGGGYLIGGISSIRASKKNIEDVSNVDWLYKLNPVTFNYRKLDENKNYTEEIYEDLNYGLIAEDTQPVADFLINYDNTNDEKKMIGIEYSRLITPMLKAIQELKSQNDDLQAQITELKNK